MTNLLSKISKLRVLRTFNGYETIHICTRNSHWTKYSYLNGISSVPLKPYTIGGIFDDMVKQTPDREYVVSTHENKVYTYAAMDTEVDKLCRSFNAIGLKPGDRVAIWMPNCALYFSTIIATARLGLILVNINPAYQSEELKHSLTLVGVKCLITLETFKTQNYPEILKKVDPDIFSQRSVNSAIKSKVLPTLETVVLHSENRINGTYNLESFFDLGSGKSYNVPNVQPDDGCNIQFTSGTTGKPKAALLNHFGLINNAYFIMKRIGIISDDQNTLHKLCCPMPLFHAFALSAAVIGTLISQSTVYLPSAHFEPKVTVDVITKEKCTFYFGTPTMYVDIMSVFEKLPPEQRDNALKLAITGGAPCSPDLMKKFKKTFPDAVLTSVFGMTETSPCSFQNRYDDSEEKILSTVGFIQEHVEAKVVDKNGQMVPFGTPGELLVRGYLNMNGYFNDDKKTKETIDSNGWLHTGDQFVMYENGYGNHVGRIKELIIRGGENIYPKEIEYFLESHPQITQAQVYGIPDKRMGEEVCASVTLVEDSEVTEADIKAYSKGKIAHFKIPKYIFIERGKFPLTASGKVQKFKLAEMAQQRIASRT